MKVRFLETHKSRVALKQLLKVNGTARLAVAYWGAGACEKLGLPRAGQKTRVICDLFSGACNPEEMKNLLDAKVDVRTRDGLHAKVYCVGDKTIIGSSNASSNGLGMEGKEASGNFEANAEISCKSFASDVIGWFDRIWDVESETLKVDKQMIDDVDKLRKLRPKRDRLSSRTLLNRAAIAGAVPRNIFVLVYDTDMDEKAEQAFKEGGRKYYEADELRRHDEVDEIPAYQDVTGKIKVSAGDILLDYWADKKAKRLSFQGIWQIRPDTPFLKNPNGGRLLLARQLAGVPSAGTLLRFPKSEQTILKQLILPLLTAKAWNTNEKGYILMKTLSEVLPLKKRSGRS